MSKRKKLTIEDKKLSIFGHEIYCRDGNRYMTLPPEQLVIDSGHKIPLPNPEINVGKYYYLEELYNFGWYDSSIVDKFLKILDWIHEHTQRHYDEGIVETLVKHCPKVAPLFTIIYLAMLDLEIGSSYRVGSGKKLSTKVAKQHFAIIVIMKLQLICSRKRTSSKTITKMIILIIIMKSVMREQTLLQRMMLWMLWNMVMENCLGIKETENLTNHYFQP